MNPRTLGLQLEDAETLCHVRTIDEDARPLQLGAPADVSATLEELHESVSS